MLKKFVLWYLNRQAARYCDANPLCIGCPLKTGSDMWSECAVGRVEKVLNKENK